MLGIPDDYGVIAPPPAELSLEVGPPLTNFRNESEWGYGWIWYGGAPANIHWNHTANTSAYWNVDQDEYNGDSRMSCVMCHTPHGTRNAEGMRTPGMTMADLDIRYGVYNDGETDHHYGYIGSSAFREPGGDLHCWSCHYSGAGADPPGMGGMRFYRNVLDRAEQCLACHATYPEGGE